MNTAAYQEKLSAEKARLEDEMSRIGHRNLAVPGDWEAVAPPADTASDLADHADLMTSRETNEGILADLEARYDHVLAALSRIEKGEYGTCAVCGKKIEEDRLSADAAATTCKEHL